MCALVTGVQTCALPISRVVVMADKARDMLINVYGADPGKIDVIAHGIPDVPLASARAAKERLGFTDRKVILTFGLMSPNKGIETMIEAKIGRATAGTPVNNDQPVCRRPLEKNKTKLKSTINKRR